MKHVQLVNRNCMEIFWLQQAPASAIDLLDNHSSNDNIIIITIVVIIIIIIRNDEDAGCML